jgi:hypothetical protein
LGSVGRLVVNLKLDKQILRAAQDDRRHTVILNGVNDPLLWLIDQLSSSSFFFMLQKADG